MGRRRLRRPGIAVPGLVALAGFAAGLVFVAVDDGVGGVNAGLVDKAVGGLVLSTLAWVCWRVAVYPSVDLTPSSLVVRQPGLRVEAPWQLVGTADALDGLRITIGGHGTVRPWAFSSSLLGSWTGEWSANRAVYEINKMRSSAVACTGSAKRHIDIGLPSLLIAWSSGLTAAAIGWQLP